MTMSDTESKVVIPRHWDLLPNALTAIRAKFASDNDADAFERLKVFLLDERVHARGQWQRNGVQPIPAEEFRCAVLSPDASGFKSIASFRKAPWIEINMDELAGALASVSVPRPKKGDPAEAKALEWLIRDIEQNPASPKSSRREYAVRQFGIKVRAFDDRVWKDALKNSDKKGALTKAGRKPKSNHRTK